MSRQISLVSIFIILHHLYRYAIISRLDFLSFISAPKGVLPISALSVMLPYVSVQGP
jgi:hypothetical protein